MNPESPLIPKLLVTGISAVLFSAVVAQTEPPVLRLLTEPEQQDIELDPDLPVSIDPDNGNIVITPRFPTQACQGGGCDDVTVEISEFLPEDNPIVRFSSQSIEVSWDSKGSWECRGQGSSGLDNTAWVSSEFNRQPSGEATITLNSVPTGMHTMGLECRNGPNAVDTAVRNLEIIQVTAGDCTGRDAPSGMSREITLLKEFPDQTTRIWTDVYGTFNNEVNFPDGKLGSPIIFQVFRDKYGQIDFTTVNLQTGDKGRWSATQPTGDFGGPFLAAVSECPGDFGAALEDPCRKVLVPGSPSNIIFWAEASVAGTNDCPLELEKQYFLNLVPTTTLPDSQDVDWNCNGSTPSRCEITLTHRLR